MEQNIESEINPCDYTQITFDKSTKNTHMIKDILFSKWCWENFHSYRRMKLVPYPSSYVKNKLKWSNGVDYNIIMSSEIR
jgi:hypothetical protein